jgi:tetratricopeptide (TPR) repeat protein
VLGLAASGDAPRHERVRHWSADRGGSRVNAWEIAKLVDSVDSARSRDEMRTAEEQALAGLDRFPDSADLLVAYGRVLFATHRVHEALKVFTQAGELAPEDDRPVAWQVAAYAREFDLTTAIATGHSALERFPDSVLIRVALGRAYLDSSRPKDALVPLVDAIRISPEDETAASWHAVCLSSLAGTAAAVDQLRTCLGTSHLNSVKVHYCMGQILLENRQHAEALECFDAVLEADAGHAKALEGKIIALRELGRFNEAEDHAARAVELLPGSPRLRVEYAWVLNDQGKYRQAVHCAALALKTDERSVEALIARIDCLREWHKFADAEDAAAEALKVWPGEPDIHTAAAWVYGDEGLYEQALDHIAKALASDPTNIWALRSRIDLLREARRFKAAEDAADEAIGLLGQNSDVLVSAAWVHSDQGNYKRALDLAEEAIGLDGRSSWALCSRIDFLREMRRFGDAGQAAREAMDLLPDDAAPCVAAAWVSSVQDQEPDAAGYAERALALDGNNRAALAALIYFRRWAREWEKARVAAAEALRRRPGDPDILAAAGWLHSDQDEHDQALERIGEAADIKPRDPWVLSCLINFLSAAGDYDGAEKASAQALKVLPDHPDMLVAAGWLQGDLDRYGPALARFRQALDVSPRHAEALEWEVVALRSLLRFGAAKTAAARGTELRPWDPPIRVELGRACDDLRDYDAAFEHFAEILTNEPGNVEALVAKSAALRPLHRYEEAENGIRAARREKLKNRDLTTELGWVRYDANSAHAGEVFQGLLESAVNNRERAAARYGLGWIAFKAEDYSCAEAHFRQAVEYCKRDSNYSLARAWSLARQDLWDEAEKIASEISERRPDPFAHICLGVIAFQCGRLAEAEHHLKYALELDPRQGGYTSLGALYMKMARYDEAEAKLNEAVARDWYDSEAHIALGCVLLQVGDKRLPDAEREFRQALALEPESVKAAIGLARTLVMTDRYAQSEAILREALARQSVNKRWETHQALAWLLVRQGDKEQNQDLLEEAYEHAKQAIEKAPEKQSPDAEAGPHFVAGLALLQLASLTAEPWLQGNYQRRAIGHLRKCLNSSEYEIDARRYMQLLKRERRAERPAAFGGLIVGFVSLVLLAVMWIAFFRSTRVSATVLSVNTPILIGLLTVSLLLPWLIRLKMPGFEAELQPQHKMEAAAVHIGAEAFRPGRFTVTVGLIGEIPRRGQSRPQTPKHLNSPFRRQPTAR